jgi:hypothetical protein
MIRNSFTHFFINLNRFLEHKSRVFENKLLWKMFQPERNEFVGNGVSYVARNLVIGTFPVVLMYLNEGCYNKREM